MKLQRISASVLAYTVLAAAWICNTIEEMPLFEAFALTDSGGVSSKNDGCPQ